MGANYNAYVTDGRGDIAQLVERTDRTREVRGSNPLVSNFFHIYRRPASFLLIIMVQNHLQ
jgi:hypothetical protein